MLIFHFSILIENMKWAYGSPCEGVGNWCPTTVPQAGGSGGRKCGIQYCINWRVFSRRTGSPQAGSYVRKKCVKNVHFRAQIGQKPPLFAPETHFLCTFQGGEGRLFGRPKNPYFWGFRVSRSPGRETQFPDTSHVSRFHDATLCIIFNKSECLNTLFNALHTQCAALKQALPYKLRQNTPITQPPDQRPTPIQPQTPNISVFPPIRLNYPRSSHCAGQF